MLIPAEDLTLADNLDSFKTNLDRLLLSFRDTPPISGDETQIPNSLLDRPGKETTECCQADDCRVRRDGLVDPSHYLFKGIQR